MKQKGFTLIELLVVIAIIGLLSSLAIVSLSSARNKAYDAQVKSDLSQFRTYAEVTYPEGIYTGLAIGDVVPTLTPPACSADAATYVVSLANGDTAWAAWADLCSADGDFCVDSTGNAKVVAAGVADGATVFL